MAQEGSYHNCFSNFQLTEGFAIASPLGFPGGTSGKEPTCNAGEIRDTGSIPGWGRSLGGGNGNPLLYFCLENPKDSGPWWPIVHGVAKSRT